MCGGGKKLLYTEGGTLTSPVTMEISIEGSQEIENRISTIKMIQS
jgi:hypothetical protein